jgi:hypothetical protein
MGFGVDSCAEFSQRFQVNISIENTYFDWAQGFMSGANTLAQAEKLNSHDLSALTVEDEKSRIRSYCAAHPLNNYYEAVIDVLGGLPLVKPVP